MGAALVPTVHEHKQIWQTRTSRLLGVLLIIVGIVTFVVGHGWATNPAKHKPLRAVTKAAQSLMVSAGSAPVNNIPPPTALPTIPGQPGLPPPVAPTAPSTL